MKHRILQFLIALDQCLNCFVSLFIGGGWADETFSARCWRCGEIEGSKTWKVARKVVDTIMKPIEKDHCRISFLDEKMRRQAPVEER